MTPRRAEAGVAAAMFIAAAIWGGLFYGRYLRSGGRPFFYQTYFEPAVLLACGKGFVVAHPQPAAVRAFLFETTDRLACSDLPRDLQLGTEGLYQRPWRYLMTAVALTWMVQGISWSGLAPLFGVLFGTTTVLAYTLFRLLARRPVAIACAAALSASTTQLANLPHLRDYAKAPFMVALVVILVALVVRPMRRRDMLLLALCYGLVMGVGYGFRTDLLVAIPPFLITVALFLPGGVRRNLAGKVAAVALFAAGFAAAGWPIIATVVSSGGCQWHVFLLGLTKPFDDALGVSGGAYRWGHLYKDEYLWATVASYANRFRPDLGYIEYCSHEYDVASWEYLRHIILTFPADMLTRAYASALRVLDLPFRGIAALTYAGSLLAAVLVLVVGATSLRRALFAVFVILYFGGHTAIQFLPRHYFPLEVLGWAVVAFLIDRGAGLGIAIARTGRFERHWVAQGSQDSPEAGEPREPREPRAYARNISVCAVVVAGLLIAPLGPLRWYQDREARRLLTSYVAAPTSAVLLHTVAPGRFRLPDAGDARTPTEIEAVAALGRAQARFLEAEFDAGCRPGTTVTFQYDPTYSATNFSQTVPLRTGTGDGKPTRLFEPVYAGFRGIDVSDPSPACFERLLAVTDPRRFPLLLPVQLSPGWESQPQYQRIDKPR
jgi:hypothetical protein